MKIRFAIVATAAVAAVGLAPVATADGDLTNRYGLRDYALSPMSQQNAVRKAQDYLDYAAFSREGLINQLEFDGFSTSDAIFAVDSITVDWNEQAVKKAMDYLEYTAFSREGLIDQLEFDGFTPAQAAHGVAATGL
jgi:hypothetical protein